MNQILKLCIIISIICGTNGQTAKCDYIYKHHWTTGYKTTNTSYYTCYLDTRQSNYNERVASLDGEHKAGHNDVGVHYLAKFKSDKLQTFSSIFCQKFPNLKAIKIVDAYLESVDEDSFQDCKNLNHLLFDDNRIRELPEYLLLRNSKLTILGIDSNRLTTLPDHFFLSNRNLELLYMENNQISFLPSSIFRPAVSLKVLYLHNNQLDSIDPEWFATLQNLKFLSLNGNQILEVPSKAFASLRAMDKLYLHKNGIKTLKSDSFDGLHHLQILSLDVNDISELPAGVFTPLTSLQELFLNRNKLKTISSNSFGIHRQLTKLYLENNQIRAIDPEFIDNTAVSILNMTNNICSSSLSQSLSEVRNDLRNCFVNYQTRSVQLPFCGRSVMPQGNIVGGAQIKRNSYPWIAALMTPSGQFFCGGILVSNRKVVTAAHCIQNKGDTRPLLPRSVVVLLGFHDLSISIEVGRVPYAVQAINIHPDWNTQTTSYDADIAVLMLSRDVTFNEYIQPICMTSSDSRIAAMTEGAVVGNGKGGEANEYEPIPKILKMPIQTAQHCTEKDYTFRQLLTGRTFCAGSGNGQGVCTGDSGSGFIVKIGTAFYLRGVVSASLANSYLGCDVDSYSVFTDALKFISWIDGLRAVPADDSDRIIFAS